MNICSEQDCQKDTGNSAFILCNSHYQQFRNGNLNPCPAHPATYKPTKYPTCRQCLQIRTDVAEPPTGAKPMSTCAERGCRNQTILPEWLLCEAHWDKYTKGYPDCENPPAFCTVPKCKNPTSSVYRLCHPHWLERQNANREWNQQPEPQNQGIQQQNPETSVPEPKELNDQIASLHQEIIEYHRNWERRYNRDTERIRNATAYASAAREINLMAGDLGLKYVRTLNREEIHDMGLKLAQGTRLSGNLRSFARADIIFVAEQNGEERYVPVEVSYTADQRDTDRAIRNAEYLTRLTGVPAFPAVACVNIDNKIQSLIESGQVHHHELEDTFLPEE